MATVGKRADKKTNKRTVAVYAILLVLMAAMILRLFSMQVLDYDEYQAKVIEQITHEFEINPNRGEIFDRNGKLLATNITVYTVVISPQDIIDAMAEEPDAVLTWTRTDAAGEEKTSTLPMNRLIATFFAETLGVSYDTVIAKAAKNGRKYEIIATKVKDDLADKVRAFIDEYDLHKQIFLEAGTMRYYPYGSLAAHVIGFTNADGKGVYGLESYYNNLLEGASGRYIEATDPLGNDMPYDYESFIDAENGSSIITTLDVTIQHALETQLREAYIDSEAGNRVTGIVMDVKTGAILAMATYPTFDLNDPYTLDEYSAKELKGLEKGTDEYTKKYYELLYSMWTNKAVTDSYIPGSTFKILTSAMALEENTVTPDTMFYCGGKKTVVEGVNPVHCHKTSGHGSVSFAVGLQQSCNVVFMDVGEKLGAEKFYNYLEAFGYKMRTGIDLPAEGGSIILARKSFNIDILSQQIYAFGQNFNVTAIQQLAAISAVANGGSLLTPHLLSSIEDADGNVVTSYETNVVRQVISAATCQTLSDILEEGVSGNGGAKNAHVEGYKIAAKTGTSEKKDKAQTGLRVGSCVAYAPSDNPQIAAIIIVDEPSEGASYGSVVAAPYVGNLMGTVLPYIGVEAAENEKNVMVSSYVGLSRKAAENALSYEGIQYEIIGDGDKVMYQVPASGSKISKDTGRVILYTGDESPERTVKVPDFSGMTVSEANKKLVNLGLNIAVSGPSGGDATVIGQSVTAGTYVPRGTLVTITVRHMDIADD